MRVAILAHLRHPIGPPFMGGMEAHAHTLTLALAARGHEVTLFAAGDSDPALPLHPILDRHYEADEVLLGDRPRDRQRSDRAKSC